MWSRAFRVGHPVVRGRTFGVGQAAIQSRAFRAGSIEKITLGY